MFIRSLRNPIVRMAENDDGGGTGSGELTAAVEAAVAKATAGLVAKNAELLNEIKGERTKRTQLEQQIHQIGDTGDIAKAREVMDRMQADADLRMIAEGGKPAFEDVLTRRTKSIITDAHSKVEAAEALAREAEGKAREAQDRWRSERLNARVSGAVAKAKAIPEAGEFIHMKASQMFELDDESGDLRLRESVKEGAIDRNGNPHTLDTWVESLRDSQPFFFGMPSGGGAGGNNNRDGGRAPVRINGNDPRAVSNNLEAIAKGNVVVSSGA